jgi:nicotinamidase-related amidase
VEKQEPRTPHVGWRNPCRVRAQAGEIVAEEHWCSSGFANTDLDLRLKKHGIHQLIVIGLIAHTCIEATVRYAAELGYEVTVVENAAADYSDEMMQTALAVNMPNYANAIVTADEMVDAISSLQRSGLGAQTLVIGHSQGDTRQRSYR